MASNPSPSGLQPVPSGRTLPLGYPPCLSHLDSPDTCIVSRRLNSLGRRARNISSYFFLLQAGGIIIQLALVALLPLGKGKVRQAFNVCFCGFWLFCTRRFLFENLIVAGFWEHGVAG